MDQDFSTLGGRIRHARLLREITQDDLARGTNVRSLAISRAERGETVPRAELIVAIAKLTGCSAEWLLTGKGRAPKRGAA